MPTVRCVVKYSLCALSGYGLTIVAVQVPALAQSSSSSSGGQVPNGREVATDDWTIPTGNPLDPDVVVRVVEDVQAAAGTSLLHPLTQISPCSGGTHCGTISVKPPVTTGGGGIPNGGSAPASNAAGRWTSLRATAGEKQAVVFFAICARVSPESVGDLQE